MYDRESEPETLFALCTGQAGEFLEDALAVARCHALTGIGYGKRQLRSSIASA